jgi:hypothetical protein
MPECPRHVPVSINHMNFLNIHKIHANRTQVTLAHDLSVSGLIRQGLLGPKLEIDPLSA